MPLMAALEQGTAQDLAAILDGSLDMLCIRDMQGRVVRVNRAWEMTLGYSVAELAKTPLLPLMHPEDVAVPEQGARVQDRTHQAAVAGRQGQPDQGAHGGQA